MNYNSEWALMFGNRSSGGGGGSGGGTGVGGRLDFLLASNELARAQMASVKRAADCTQQLESYLDRCKLVYDEQRVKSSRLARPRDTMNASVSSNLTCLSSSGTTSSSSSYAKWRPRGYIVAHSNEHAKSIDRLCRNADSTYFATCSSSESCVKIWSTESLLDGKSGFFKSTFTYDRHSSGAGNANNQASQADLNKPHGEATATAAAAAGGGMSTRPCCINFYGKNTLAILCEDFKFYVIDFNSSRTQYRLYGNEKLFKQSACRGCGYNNNSNSK